MKNELFSIGPFVVYGYGLMTALGILAAYLVGEYRAKKYKLDPDVVFSLMIWCLLGGYAGSKVLYLLTIWKEIIANPRLLLNVSDGFVVYGGLIAGILSAILYCRIKKVSFLQYFDLFMPSVALAQSLGRIGCFLAGCCYGKETTSAFHIIFHDSNYAPNGVPLIPTQLISSALDFLLFLILLFLAKRKKGDGQVAGFYLIFYSVGRFVIEFFRGDLIRGSVGILSTSQFIAIFMLAAGVLLVWFRHGKFVQIEELKAEAGKLEESKTEADRSEEGKSEESRSEAGKSEESRSEAGKLEESKTEADRSEESKLEESKTEADRSEKSRSEAGESEESKSEEGKFEEGKTEAGRS